VSRPPWEVDPDAEPRVLTLGETLLGLEHYGRDWWHCTNLQYLRPDGEPDGPPRAGLLWLLRGSPDPLPRDLDFAVRLYERELKAIADCRRAPCDLPWRVAAPPPPTLEEGERTLREIRVDLWLAELAREHGGGARPPRRYPDGERVTDGP
jgi:hypothetical protein